MHLLIFSLAARLAFLGADFLTLPGVVDGLLAGGLLPDEVDGPPALVLPPAPGLPPGSFRSGLLGIALFSLRVMMIWCLLVRCAIVGLRKDGVRN